ncbi:MAG TPA: lyase family protein, partial [Acidimicrobiia bacterium]|nr:lyase family protein [Acidimicrobiia bacterium]
MADKEARPLWHGRFEEGPSDELLEFTVSLDYDRVLAKDDLAGSRAHVAMLEKVGLLAAEEKATLLTALARVEEELESGTFAFAPTDEDIHTAIERRVTELAPAGAKLHTGRSRNDQVINDVRLWTKRGILRLTGGLIDLADALLSLAGEHVETIMPGFTHTQRAQPVTLGHHLLAHVSMFERDFERFQQAYARMDRSALGASAMAGTTYPIDRAAVAHDLGFGGITRNS